MISVTKQGSANTYPSIKKQNAVCSCLTPKTEYVLSKVGELKSAYFCFRSQQYNSCTIPDIKMYHYHSVTTAIIVTPAAKRSSVLVMKLWGFVR